MTNLETLKRTVQADPANTDAAIALTKTRARIEGPNVLLECLADRKRWNETPDELQDLTIAEAARRFDDFELDRVGVWSSWNREILNCSEIRRIEPDTARYEFGSTFSHRLATFRHLVTGMEMNLVPGKLDKRRALGLALDSPPQPVIEPFLVGRWPVLAEEVLATLSYPRVRIVYLVAACGVNGKQQRTMLPVFGESHFRAAHCLESSGLRLPTAVEWQYACKAGTTTKWYFGNELDDSHVWHAANSGRQYPSNTPQHQITDVIPSGLRPVTEHEEVGKWNAFGLVDMIGNVWEWVDSEKADFGAARVFGGSFNTWVQASDGYLVGMNYRSQGADDIGFRAACSIPGYQSNN